MFLATESTEEHGKIKTSFYSFSSVSFRGFRGKKIFKKT